MKEANQWLEGCSFSIYSVLKQNQDQYKSLVSGGDGLIHWEIKEEELLLEWDPVEYENGTLYQEEVEYFIFASRS